MRVKLRPDTHYAPVPQGVYWSRAGQSFVMTGPRALYALVDDRLDALLSGTSVDDMVAAAGDEAARPIFQHIVRMLVDRDVLIDLDAVEGPIPDDDAAGRHAELLSYLEAHCVEPYRAFNLVRSAWSAVAGSGPAVRSALRGLEANGTGRVTEHADLRLPDGDAPPSLVVLTDDYEHPVDLMKAAATLPAGVAVLPVVTEATFALVGPVCEGSSDVRSFQALRSRVAEWQRADAASVAPRPLSAVLAGALAAQAVLARLAGTQSYPRDALLVHGHAVQTRPLRVSEDGGVARWRPIDAAEALTEATGAGSAGSAGSSATITHDGDGPVDPQEVPRHAMALTTRWTGLARWNPDLDLPQLPANLVTVEMVADVPSGAPRPNFLGWGADRAAAGVSAMLAVLRRRATQVPGASVRDGLAAAGLTRAHWLVDGLLRQVGHSVLEHSSGTPMAWEELRHGAARTYWSLLDDFFGLAVEVRLHAVLGIDWCLADVVQKDAGRVLACEWGPSPNSAAYAALFAATARAQFEAARKTAPQAPVLPSEPVGTWALEAAPVRQVHDCLRRLLEHARSTGMSPSASQLTHDDVLGELPLVCGRVKLG